MYIVRRYSRISVDLGPISVFTYEKISAYVTAFGMEELEEDEAYKFGVQYEPPSLVYIYRDRRSGKLARFMMPVKNFNADSDCKLVARDMKNRHENKLKLIALNKVEIALRLLVSYMKGDNSKRCYLNRRLFHVGWRTSLPQDLTQLTRSELNEVFKRRRRRNFDENEETTTNSENDGDSSFFLFVFFLFLLFIKIVVTTMKMRKKPDSGLYE